MENKIIRASFAVAMIIPVLLVIINDPDSESLG